MIVRVYIATEDCPPDADPILEFIPLFREARYRLVENGVDDVGRYLGFVAPQEASE